MEAWTTYIQEKAALAQSLTPHYQNEAIPDGLEKVKKIKPTVAILSLEAYLTLAPTHKMTVIAQTRMQPSGDGSNHYALYKKKGNESPTNILMSEPLGDLFVRNILLRNAPAPYRSLPLQHSRQILQALKKVGRGENNDAVLINAYEEAVLQKLSGDWAQSLERTVKGPQLPAPLLVFFEEWAEDFPRDTFQEALFKMDQDPEGKDLLAELRLTGFKAPEPEAYQKLQELFQ